jgi:hypothetical protein
LPEAFTRFARSVVELSMSSASDLDQPLWGAEAIGREAGLVRDDGSVDMRRVFYQLECGYIDASKSGRLWVSTPRRVRRRIDGGEA